MSAADSVYTYDGTELGAPGPEFMNLLADSVKAGFLDVEDQIADLDLQTDSGWVLIPAGAIGAGWQIVAADPPRIRRVGSRVDVTGALTWLTSPVAGSWNALLTIPVGFRLTGTYTDVTVGPASSDNGVYVTLKLAKATNLLRGTSVYPVVNPTVVRLDGSYYLD